MSFAETTKNGVTVTYSQSIAGAGGAVHAFSTRLGGVSAGIYASLNLGSTRGDDPDCVRENYRRFFQAAGVDLTQVAMSNQVHGDVVRPVTSADRKRDLYDPEGYEADGLVTDLPGVSLVIFGADCLPILLYDPVRRVAAAVHAGWRGTAAGIAATAVERMKEVYDCRPEDILAAVGPGIGPCCFETHEDVPNAMMAAVSSAALPYVKVLENGKFSLDLKGINARLLERAGLDASHIAVCQECTACMAEKYWSHRRMGNNRGSMAAAIQLL